MSDQRKNQEAAQAAANPPRFDFRTDPVPEVTQWYWFPWHTEPGSLRKMTPELLRARISRVLRFKSPAELPLRAACMQPVKDQEWAENMPHYPSRSELRDKFVEEYPDLARHLTVNTDLELDLYRVDF